MSRGDRGVAVRQIEQRPPGAEHHLHLPDGVSTAVRQFVTRVIIARGEVLAAPARARHRSSPIRATPPTASFRAHRIHPRIGLSETSRDRTTRQPKRRACDAQLLLVHQRALEARSSPDSTRLDQIEHTANRIAPVGPAKSHQHRGACRGIADHRRRSPFCGGSPVATGATPRRRESARRASRQLQRFGAVEVAPPAPACSCSAA